MVIGWGDHKDWESDAVGQSTGLIIGCIRWDCYLHGGLGVSMDVGIDWAGLKLCFGIKFGEGIGWGLGRG